MGETGDGKRMGEGERGGRGEVIKLPNTRGLVHSHYREGACRVYT